MKIVTWNVNGLRSCVSDGFENWLYAEMPDIVCLQETRLGQDLLTGSWFPGYHFALFPSIRPGYGGVGTLYRSGVRSGNVVNGIDDLQFDGEGRVQTVIFSEYLIINIYAPHSHRELKNLEKKIRFLNLLIEYIARMRLYRVPILIAGDFNVAFEERDLHNFRQNKGNAGFHAEERRLFANILDLGFADTLRIINQDSGVYTWWSPLKGVRERNVGWRLDYILAEGILRKKVTDAYASPLVLGSDHCPYTIELE